ncbi:threonine ammonia-lyase [Haliangium sp.]|uniref:threonine ammonia-lyase n=1 Tax=Haliangium sp. TaxID=2663208 RepID=UPI003D12D1C3
MSDFPITIDDARAARERIRPHLAPTPLRHYDELDAALGHGLRVLVKHENHHPTNAFKIRNGVSALTALPVEARRRGVIAASRGNHGQGVAWAGRLLGIPATICVPEGNNPEKNAAMRALGAELVVAGRDYDDTQSTVERLVAERGLTIIHPTNNPNIIAGAATITLEILDQIEAEHADRAPLQAMVIAVGGGSQAVGALTVLRALRPEVEVYAVQAAGAAAIHDGWHAKQPVTLDRADTFADGLATRSCYEGTFPALCAGLTDFITVTEAEIADALRLYLRTTHNLTEGAAAAPLAGLRALAPRLEGKTVALIHSGANIDADTLRAVLTHEL